ncbi:MAG: hypothetical protein A2X88_07170 [Deltaproteobacteria bacterium GWC2_65_14]|nr:MAG: hypothetical protein A2X88_07170 [Deltaproteobacteria bacterium GWC2_65_14]
MKDGEAYSAPRGAAIVLWVLPALFLLVSAHLSSRILQERSSFARTVEGHAPRESLLFEISRNPAFAFGFRNFLGDLAWLSAVQVAGSRNMAPGEYDRLYVLLQAVGNFDPRFVVPYILGGMVLGDSPRHVREALDILDRGAKSHPTDWRFPFYIGYTRYFSLGDPLEGAKALEEAARLPESPPYLPLLAARMFAEGRAPETALAFLERMVREETDPARLEILNRRIGEVIVERDIQALEKSVAAYRAAAGALPGALDDLVRAGLIRTIPEEPNGGAYILAPDGTVRSNRVATRLKVFRKQ